MNLTPENKKKFTKWIIGIAAACILIYLGVQNIGVLANALDWVGGVVMPLTVGFAMAVVLNVPIRFLEVHLWKNTKKPFLVKARRPVAFILSLLFILGILVGAVVVILPTLVDTVTVLIQSAIDMIDRFNSMSDAEISELPFGELLLEINWNGLLDSFKNWAKDQADTIINTVFGTASSFVVAIIDLFISVAFAIYLLFSKEKLKDGFKRLVRVWLPEKKAEWFLHALSVANVNFRCFIAGQFIEAIILGVLCFLGMLIFGFPYAAMISTFVGVTALIPVIGSYLGGGIGAFMILTVDPIKALWFIVYIIVLQQIEGNVIYPKVMGNSVNLSAMWILAAVTVGGGVAGPVGILLSVPLLSTIFTLFAEATDKREARLYPESAREPISEEPPIEISKADELEQSAEIPKADDLEQPVEVPEIFDIDEIVLPSDDAFFEEETPAPKKTRKKKQKNNKKSK